MIQWIEIGTGKTTVAKIYGRILQSLNLLSNGDVVYKTASDFKGNSVGASESKTRSILKLAEGKVLLIDEAYTLDDSMYGKNVLDTITELVHGNPGEDLAVVMAGYKPQMLQMFRNQNPGLSRRMNLSLPFYFQDYNDSDLFKIVSMQLKSFEVDALVPVKKYIVSKLSKQRSLPNFGNAGETKTLITNAMKRMTIRCNRSQEPRRLEIVDIDDESENKEDPMLILDNLYGLEKLKSRLKEISSEINIRKMEGASLKGLFKSCVFTGKPGTGKTHVAKLMGKILHAYGILATDHVEITSAQKLCAGFVGQTSIKVRILYTYICLSIRIYMDLFIYT